MLDRPRTRLASALALCATAAGFCLPAQTAQAQANPYIGTMMTTTYNFCPRGWALADGQLLPISQNTALFSLLGTTFGGDGVSTFALPDLRGRSQIGFGTGPGLPPATWGQRAGNEQHTLTIAEMPAHNHLVNASNEDADKRQPATDFLGDPPGGDLVYHDGPPDVQMAPDMIANTGGSQAFSVRDPYLGMNTCIALVGIFPSRN